MILGIGIDIVNVDRMRHWMENPTLLERFFHHDEIAGLRKRKSGAVLSLAARFAAKEAFGKALGTGMRGLVLKDIQVVNSHNGNPSMRLFGTALAALEAHRGKSIHLSLTHEKESAVAVVIIEGA
ncbi:MAG TPA: holo-ACP synthase [Sediminispirochaeta sp.]|nr:holo-ACP synthase [Sediminispirochaeta sp.]